MGSDKVWSDPQTGQNYWHDGTQFRPVPPNFDPTDVGIGQALDFAARRTVRGVERLLTDDPEAAFRQREAQQGLTAIGTQSPGAELGAEVATAAPEVAAGLAVGGPAGVALGAGLGGLVGSTQTPDNPLLGAGLGFAGGAAGPLVAPLARAGARQGGSALGRLAHSRPGEMATRALDSIRGSGIERQAARARRQADAAAARAATETGQGAAGARLAPRNQRPDLLSEADLAAQGVPMTAGQRGMLNALQTGEDVPGAAARFRDESLQQGINDAGTRFVQQERFTRRVLSEIDADASQTVISPQARLLARQEASAVFEDGFKHATDINTGALADDIDQAIDGVVSRDSREFVERSLGDFRDQMREGEISAQSYAATRNRLRREMERLYRAGDAETGGALSDVIEAMDSRLMEAAPESTANRMAEARHKWRVVRTLEETNVVNPEGFVNPKSFSTRWNNRRGSAQRRGDVQGDFDKWTRTAEFLNFEPVRSSGTTERMRASGLLGPLGLGGGAGVGIASLLGL
jgi:hypothetical protein